MTSSLARWTWTWTLDMEMDMEKKIRELYLPNNGLETDRDAIVRSGGVRRLRIQNIRFKTYKNIYGNYLIYQNYHCHIFATFHRMSYFVLYFRYFIKKIIQKL
jgi:hypothetical protein